MANLKQAKTDEEIKKLGVNSVKKAYHELALDYNHILDGDYIYCPHCGKWKSVRCYYGSDESKDGIEHFACKECVLDMCTSILDDGTRIDNREKTIATFRRLNWYFNEKDYNAQIESLSEGVNEKLRGTAAQQLIVMVRSLGSKNWKGLTFKDSEFIIEDDENNPEANIKIVQKTLRAAKKRFGNYSNEDLMFLENEYQDWITRYECNTKAQETIFERLAFKKWEINKATKAGQNTKDLDKTYTDLLASVNILPRQNADNGLDSSLTFGQLIEQWENNKPIPDPDPEFADVNHMAKYIKTWFKGSLARSIGIDNGYSKEYDDELQKYSVKKQDYSADDESDDIYKTVFGDNSQ
jgi:hypothetical protein